MENLDPSKRKRHSSSNKMSPEGIQRKKKSIHSSTVQLTSSSSPHSHRLIDQLYQTWKEVSDFTNQTRPSKERQKIQASQSSISKQAAIRQEKISLEQKLSVLRKEKSEFCKTQMMKERKQKICVDMFNKAWESVSLIYEDIKYIHEKEESFDHHFSDSSEIRFVITQKLKEKSEKIIAAPNEEDSLEIEISNEKGELENLVETLWKLKEEDEKIKDTYQECSLDIEQNLNIIKGTIDNLIEDEIGLEIDLQKKTSQSLAEDNKYAQDHQELETQFNELKTELKDLYDVDEMLESVNAKIREIISEKLNTDSSIEIDFTEEIKQTKAKVKEFELKTHLGKQLMESVKYLVGFDNKLTDIKKSINLLLIQNTDLMNLDESLKEVNKELKLFESEQTCKEIELRNHELEELIRQREILDQENVEILQELNKYLNCKEEEQLIRDLELDLAQKEKLHNERMENYKKMKEANSEHFDKNPNLLESKCFKDFEDMKKNSEATLNSVQQREKSSEKEYELKLKVLKYKAKKYLASIREIDQEFNLTEKQSNIDEFTNLEKQIKDAEETLQKKKNALQKKALPVITKDEPVQMDMKTLSLIKSLTKKLPEKPTYTLFSDDESLDSNVRFERLERVYKGETVMLNNKPKNTEDFDKELPLSLKSLKSFPSEQNSTEVGYSFPLTQSNKENPSSQISFDELLSQYGSQKSNKSVLSSSQTKLKKSSSQQSLDKDKSENQLQKKDENFPFSQRKVEVSTPQTRSVKKDGKERERTTEKKFFKSSQPLTKSYKRSKSVPPRRY